MKKISKLFNQIKKEEVKLASSSIKKVKKQYMSEGHICNVFVRPLRMVAFDQK